MHQATGDTQRLQACLRIQLRQTLRQVELALLLRQTHLDIRQACRRTASTRRLEVQMMAGETHLMTRTTALETQGTMADITAVVVILTLA